MSQKGFLDLGPLVKTLSWAHYVLAALLLLMMILLNNWRWNLLLSSQDLSIGFWRVVPLTFIGLFFNFAVPGGVGGDVVKGYYLIKGRTEKRMVALLTILMDRLIGLWAMAFLAVVGFVTNWSTVEANKGLQLMMLSVAAVFILFCFFMAFSFCIKPESFEKLFSFLNKLPKGKYFFSIYDGIHKYSRFPRVIFYSFVLSMLSQLCAVLFIWFIGQTIEPGLPFVTYLFAVPIGFIAMALPLAPAGVGVGQAVLFFLFNLALGHQSQLGPNTITMFQIMLFLWSLIGAYFYVRKGQISGELQSVG